MPRLLGVVVLVVTLVSASLADVSGFSPTADANGDGQVDGLDYLHLVRNWGAETDEGPAAGDFNDDGVVGSLDYLLWSAATLEPLSQPAGDTDPELTPEPTPESLPAANRLAEWNIRTQGVPLPADDAGPEMVATLKMFAPLQKECISWPWQSYQYSNPELAHEIARITHSIGMSIKWDATPQRVERAFALAEATGAKIAIQYSPFHEFYAKQDARFWGEAFALEIDTMEQRFTVMANLLAAAKLAHPGVELSALEIDQEMLRSDIGPDGKPDPFGIGQQADQLAAVQAKNDIVYRACKRHFPGVDVIWHGFGEDSTYHANGQLNDGYAVAEFYNTRQQDLFKPKMFELVRSGEAIGCDKFMPAISIGGFYDVAVSGPHPGYVRNVPYPVRYSHRMGRNLFHAYFASERFEERFGPTWRVERPFLWPAPFSPTHIGYGRHFVAMVAGAHNIKKSENGWLDTDSF